MIDIGLGVRHSLRGTNQAGMKARPRQGERGGQPGDAAAAYDDGFVSHRAVGSPACLGHKAHISPRCFLRPAWSPASPPTPQKQSAPPENGRAPVSTPIPKPPLV